MSVVVDVSLIRESCLSELARLHYDVSALTLYRKVTSYKCQEPNGEFDIAVSSSHGGRDSSSAI